MKGLATKTVGELIIMIIVVIILGAASVAALPYIQSLLAQYFGLTADNAITEAVQCSVLRCINGCGDPKVQSSSWPQLLGQTCPCETVPTDFKKDNKVCEWNAQQYPVEFKLDSESAQLTKDSFPTDSKPTCVYYPGTPSGSGLITSLAPTYTFLYLPKDIVSQNNLNTENCPGSTGPQGLKSFSLVSGNYYVDAKATLKVTGFPQVATVDINNKPAYAILTPNKEQTISLADDQHYRISAAGTDFTIYTSGNGLYFKSPYDTTQPSPVSYIGGNTISEYSGLFSITYTGDSGGMHNFKISMNRAVLSFSTNHDGNHRIYNPGDEVIITVNSLVGDIIKIDTICRRNADGSCPSANVVLSSQTVSIACPIPAGVNSCDLHYVIPRDAKTGYAYDITFKDSFNFPGSLTILVEAIS